jgi:hypothetical protein
MGGAEKLELQNIRVPGMAVSGNCFPAKKGQINPSRSLKNPF